VPHPLARALTLTAATLSLLTAPALATPPPPSGNGHPTHQYIIDFVPLTYWDNEYTLYGPGTLELTHAGNDPNNNTILVSVRLRQGGRTYLGSGVSLPNKLVFSVGGLFFQCDVPGWGSYHVEGNPNNLHWVYLEIGLP
jgi:hypothetical protein